MQKQGWGVQDEGGSFRFMLIIVGNDEEPFPCIRFQGSHLTRLMIHKFTRFSWKLQSKATSGNEMGSLSSNNTAVLIPCNCHVLSPSLEHWIR
jgi:hypothetical protein